MPVDFDRDLDAQQFDLLVHKATDWMAWDHWTAAAKNNHIDGNGHQVRIVAEEQATQIAVRWRKLVEFHEHRKVTVFVDDLALLRSLLDRLDMTELLRRCVRAVDGVEVPATHAAALAVQPDGAVDLTNVAFRHRNLGIYSCSCTKI